MNGRLLFIDGLRGIAASWVVVNHLVGRVSQDWFTHHGYLGVAIFFVLSGFVIAMAIGNVTISASFLGRFAARRALRLDPPYWASLVLLVLLGVLATKFGLEREMPTAEAFFAHMFYLQDLLGHPEISPVYWTLCFEVQFYLFLILLLWLGQKFRGLSMIWFAVLGLSLMEDAGIVDVAHSGFMLGYWYAFALGATTYWVIAKKMPAGCLVLAMLMVAVFAPLRHTDWHVTAILTAGVIYVAAVRGTMTTWLSDAVMQFLGRISYSLYLFHPLVGWTAMSIAMKFTNEWAALAVGIVASIASAWIAYLALERPSINLSRRVSLKPRSAPEAGVMTSKPVA